MTESEIKYLLAIYALSKDAEWVRQSDLADQMRLSRVSVLRSAENLTRKKLLDKNAGRQIRLTAEGKTRAERLTGSVLRIADFFAATLGINAPAAKREAVAVFGAVSDGTALQINQFLIEKEKTK